MSYVELERWFKSFVDDYTPNARNSLMLENDETGSKHEVYLWVLDRRLLEALDQAELAGGIFPARCSPITYQLDGFLTNRAIFNPEEPLVAEEVWAPIVYHRKKLPGYFPIAVLPKIVAKQE